MNTAIVVSMLAVLISLGAVLASVQARKKTQLDKTNSGDSGTPSTTGSGSDCGPGDAGGCDGGVGGD